MSRSSYYQRQAELLRAIAAATPDPGLRQHQLRRADEYVVLARTIPDDGYKLRSERTVSDVVQPTGKQQQQIQPDKGDPEKEGLA